MKLTHLSLVTYATPDQVAKVINSKSAQLRYAEIAYHDKDTDKDPHTHVNLWLEIPRDGQDIRKWFKACTDFKGEIANTLYEATHNTQGAHDYLTHKDQEQKYQYDDSIIKVLCGITSEYLDSTTDEEDKRHNADRKAKDKEALREAQADDVEAQLQAIIDGVPHREMARRYGRDYIKNRKAYTEYALLMHVEETGEIPDHLMNDPLQSLINQKVKQATEYTAEKVATAYEVLYNKACAEIGLSDSVTRQISIKIQKYLTKE